MELWYYAEVFVDSVALTEITVSKRTPATIRVADYITTKAFGPSKGDVCPSPYWVSKSKKYVDLNDDGSLTVRRSARLLYPSPEAAFRGLFARLSRNLAHHSKQVSELTWLTGQLAKEGYGEGS